MYQTLIIGHGNYPSGMQSAVKLLLGEDANISIIELSEDLTHEQFEQKLLEYLKEHDQVLIFADLTGGAPHQIAARVVLENNLSKEHFVISGMPLSIITDLTMKFQFMNITKDEATSTIEQSLADSKDLIQYVSTEMV